MSKVQNIAPIPPNLNKASSSVQIKCEGEQEIPLSNRQARSPLDNSTLVVK